MMKPQFVIDEIYHIYNRGVEKRNVFLGNSDYLRFIHDLLAFNNETHTPHSKMRFRESEVQPRTAPRESEVQPRTAPRKTLVDVLAFTLMPNHFHLLLREKQEKGIIRFMQKLGTGYTMYFNKKNERVGSLFQGRFKATLVDTDEYLEYLLYYIHFNCLDLIDIGWREGEIKDYRKLIEFLNRFRWSSHLDYIGKKNFPSITQREFLLKILGGENSYRETINLWLKEMSKKIGKKEFGKLILEF